MDLSQANVITSDTKPISISDQKKAFSANQCNCACDTDNQSDDKRCGKDCACELDLEITFLEDCACEDADTILAMQGQCDACGRSTE